MKLTINMCWSRLLYLQTCGELFELAISRFEILKGPCFSTEGMAGYIETLVTFEIKDLVTFTNIYESWNSLSSTQKLNMYGLAKGLGDRK